MAEEREKLLIVDDERDACEVLQEFFQRQGFEVHTATEGGMALEVFRAEKPSLVILDIKMPGMSGIEVLQVMKELRPKCRVILVTAVKDEAVWEEAKRHGANVYQTKPYDLKALHRSVNEQLAVFKMQQGQ